MNYNVCCPLTDHVLGTYVPTSEWRTKMRPLPVNAIVRGPAVEPKTNGGVPQLPTLEALQGYQPPTVTVVKDKNGEILGEIFEQRRYVPPPGATPERPRRPRRDAHY